MRKIIFQMMTTLDGRLDDPMAWVHSVSDDLYREIDRLYATYDTVLVGRTTYEEMAAYWPGALSEGTEANRSMARRMNAYKKIVVSRSERETLTDWNNTERAVVQSDTELADFLKNLKAQPGANIHLSGGASLAQSVIALDVVDELYFFVYPIASPGARWFSQLRNNHDLHFAGSRSFENGVIALHYVPRDVTDKTRPERFIDLLT